jgi:hypothetical protein
MLDKTECVKKILLPQENDLQHLKFPIHKMVA